MNVIKIKIREIFNAHFLSVFACFWDFPESDRRHKDTQKVSVLSLWVAMGSSKNKKEIKWMWEDYLTMQRLT